MPNNTPVTATVSEPVREKRPTLYSIVFPCGGSWSMRFCSSDRRAVALSAERIASGAALVVIPGECDDAPSGWRPASEPPDTQMRNVLVLCAGKDPSCAYINDGMWWESLSRLRLYNVTHWRELPEPPK